MENTVIAVYDSSTHAQSAMDELLNAGFSRDSVQLNPTSDRSTAGGTTAAPATHEEHHGSAIGNFFRSLFGMDDDAQHSDIYSEAVRRGSCVLAVNADSEEQRDRAIDIMNRHDPVDVDERSTQWRSQGWTGYDPNAPMMSDSEIQQDRSMYARDRGTSATTGASADTTTGASMNMDRDRDTSDMSDTSDKNMRKTKEGTTIPVVEEELRVGKREVQRGGVRVFQRVSERPVNESVTLREEHVNVERHPVDKPATEADLAAFKEGQVEMREMAEEPVVSKTARVVEEVQVGKEVTQRTEDVKDTVRRTDVEVEELGADGSGKTATTGAAGMRGTTADTMGMGDDADYRKHWQSAYGQQGGNYDDYASAYRYGSTLADNDRYKTSGWNDSEADIRSDWERNHPETAWEKVKDAVRYGKERVTGQRRH
ncbi:YsnF/AvaK domain-containing protein [Noviherbaspirillum massiliense]|uniref:YsnF/AvaK domain-containing protein n=1 Tax=Noviherbaspirillum massiliense TaxID=1465823 RepID=UPI0002EDFB7E|nr:YsnF/AvaK domain-containing protein [Noviherbaspirillum massiliense]